MSERIEAWTEWGVLDIPAAGAVLVEDCGRLSVRVLFSEIVGGRSDDLILTFDRVVAVMSHEESAHPFEHAGAVPRLGGPWSNYVYPVLRVSNSKWIASFAESESALQHLRIVTLDKIIDVLTDHPFRGEWAPAIADDVVMTDQPPHPGVPRWVKAFGIAGLVLLLLFIVLHLTGRGFRGHGPSSTVTEHRPYPSR